MFLKHQTFRMAEDQMTKIRNIVQILASNGFAYAQMTHKHTRYGPLLAVFEGTHSSPPTDHALIVNAEPQFRAFFPLGPAVKQCILSVVGHMPVAPRNKAFPTFRSAVYDRDGNRGPWWIWDGENENMLSRPLTDAEKRLPVRRTITAPLLVERIENGYRSETHNV
jgi:hypothetical protein